jgi:hypothetical protein
MGENLYIDENDRKKGTYHTKWKFFGRFVLQNQNPWSWCCLLHQEGDSRASTNP